MGVTVAGWSVVVKLLGLRVVVRVAMGPQLSSHTVNLGPLRSHQPMVTATLGPCRRVSPRSGQEPPAVPPVRSAMPSVPWLPWPSSHATPSQSQCRSSAIRGRSIPRSLHSFVKTVSYSHGSANHMCKPMAPSSAQLPGSSNHMSGTNLYVRLGANCCHDFISNRA